MNPEKIGLVQLALLFQISLVGSAIINAPQSLVAVAKNATWISILLASSIAVLGLVCILYLNRQYPGLTFMEYTQEAIGKWFSLLVTIPFLSVPLILLPNIVLDIGSFFKVTMMKETPLFLINFIFFLLAALTVRAGIEVMARMFSFLVIWMYISVIVILVLVSPLYHPEYLLPVLPYGFQPVLHGAYMASSFPFTDVVLLSMILPFTVGGDGKKLGKQLYGSLMIVVITLIMVTVCSIMVLGPITGNVKYSVFQLARLISLQEIIERVEMLSGIALIVGSYMKATIILFVLVLGISQLLKLKEYRNIVFPLAFITLLLSTTMYQRRGEFLEIVSVIRPLMGVSFSIAPILLITLVTLFKRKAARGHE
ncbi:GerAB/ArcD/ProY family transporter [Paenibacillus aceris]|uniref:Spore germination protein KB n=1 Tax=Paenibacillus aceris TaxID=869555 RepID=A0ABS4I2B2_9BACL|nr:endospore germination permease [Paenibacillus aceris]MBP1964566.1 spore germination protein KB [Paenibacillus aceris]NHW35725.1 endospore germination permease [Paenibacillus aceris]